MRIGGRCERHSLREFAAIHPAADAATHELADYRGRVVLVTPEARQAHYGVAAALHALGCDVRVLPSGFDCDRDDPAACIGERLFQALDDDGGALVSEVALVRGDSVTVEPVRWLWRYWLARGKLRVVGGCTRNRQDDSINGARRDGDDGRRVARRLALRPRARCYNKFMAKTMRPIHCCRVCSPLVPICRACISSAWCAVRRDRGH